MTFPYAGKGKDGWDRLRALYRSVTCGMGAAIAVAMVALPGPAKAEPVGGLPARNLVVEWRVNGMTQEQKRQQGVQGGQIIVDSRGRVVGRSGFGATSIGTESSGSSVQQLQVINGGRARLFVGQTQPYMVWQWAWVDSPISGGGILGVIGPTGAGPSSGGNGDNNGRGAAPQPRAVAQTAWIDIGQGLYVRPRWPGGRAPVLVELEAQARLPATGGGVDGNRIEPDGQTRHLDMNTTVSVPLNEWTLVARSGSQARQQQAGSLSTRDLDAMESERLEIRITAP